jgi:hypothetical protein
MPNTTSRTTPPVSSNTPNGPDDAADDAGDANFARIMAEDAANRRDAEKWRAHQHRETLQHDRETAQHNADDASRRADAVRAWALDRTDELLIEHPDDGKERLELRIREELRAQFPDEPEHIYQSASNAAAKRSYAHLDRKRQEDNAAARNAADDTSPKGPPPDWYRKCLWPMEEWIDQPDCPLTMGEKAVLARLVRWTDARTMQTKVSTAKMARQSSASEMTVIRAIKRLRELGAVKLIHQGGTNRANVLRVDCRPMLNTERLAVVGDQLTERHHREGDQPNANNGEEITNNGEDDRLQIVSPSPTTARQIRDIKDIEGSISQASHARTRAAPPARPAGNLEGEDHYDADRSNLDAKGHIILPEHLVIPIRPGEIQ